MHIVCLVETHYRLHHKAQRAIAENPISLMNV